MKHLFFQKKRSYSIEFPQTKENKIRQKALYISPKHLNEKQHIFHQFQSLDSGVRYSLIIRIRYAIYHQDSKGKKVKSGTDWKTLGNQIYFRYNEINSLFGSMDYIINVINERLKIVMEIYQILFHDILDVQFVFTKIFYTSVIAKVKTPSLPSDYHNDLINVSDVNKNLSILPLTCNIHKFGVKLSKYAEHGYVKTVKLINGTNYDISENIKQLDKNFKGFVEDTEFFQYYLKKNQGRIVAVNKIAENINTINVYGIYDGFISKTTVIDEVIADNRFKRIIGNVILNVVDNTIVSKDIKQPLKPINPNIFKSKHDSPFTNYRFGTLDFETYITKENIPRIYAGGFYTKEEKKTIYINESLDSDAVKLSCIDGILKEKYNDYVFYVHNLANFDAVFMLSFIDSLCEKHPDIYSYEPIVKDGKIICITLYKTFTYKGSEKYPGRIYKKKIKVKLADSYYILAYSLHNLCETFKPNTRKGNFPYKFVSEKTLFYEGEKPDIEYFESITKEDYQAIDRYNWSTERETIKYLEKDLMSLFEIMEKFSKHINFNYNVQITDHNTISSIAIAIFIKKYYNNNIPLINNKSIFDDIRESYYGGITEVYIPHGKGLFHYDVNSLYPYAALNPMPGLECVYEGDINKNIEHCIADMFGFYYCRIETSKGYLGLLPTSYKHKNIYNPLGKIEGWYFSEELKFAFENGYKIHVVSGYKFDKCYSVFDKYIDHFYNIKSSTTDLVERTISKSLLNNLLGRFGMNVTKSISRWVNEEEFNEILQTREITGDVKYINNKIFVTHSSDISPEICEEHEVDLKETVGNLPPEAKKSNFMQESARSVSVAISSAVTSYARIFMNRVKLEILHNKNKLFYSDTDSIVTDKPLDEKLVGSKLGQFKLVHKIKEAFFLTNKTYCIVDDKGNVTIRFSGGDPTSVTKNDFKKAYHGTDVKALKSVSRKNYQEGYTSIDGKTPIKLTRDSYTKREKIFRNKLWVNTRAHTRHFSTRKDVSENYFHFCSYINIFTKVLFIINIICNVLLADILYFNILFIDFTESDRTADTFTEAQSKYQAWKNNTYRVKSETSFINISKYKNIITNNAYPDSKILKSIDELEYSKLVEENDKLKVIISMYKLNEQKNHINWLNTLNDIIKDLN